MVVLVVFEGPLGPFYFLLVRVIPLQVEFRQAFHPVMVILLNITQKSCKCNKGLTNTCIIKQKQYMLVTALHYKVWMYQQAEHQNSEFCEYIVHYKYILNVYMCIHVCNSPYMGIMYVYARILCMRSVLYMFTVHHLKNNRLRNCNLNDLPLFSSVNIREKKETNQITRTSGAVCNLMVWFPKKF